ncbi:MAG: hypothetical protein ACOC56_00760 [Atribacterota bacterium]
MKMAIQFIGLFVGVFARTWLPYIRKLKQGKIEGFDKKFLKFAIGSVILSGISVLLIIPQYKDSGTEIIDFWTGLKVFATAFAFGFGWNTLVNESAKWNEGITKQ